MDRLWTELYLMQPTWLAAMVSREYLAKTCNTPFKDDAPALRSLISTFLDTDVNMPGDDSEDFFTPQTSTPFFTPQTSTGVHFKSAKKQTGVARILSFSQVQSPAKKVKIKVNSRNKYGETPLHLAAKKGDISRMKECLNTPGIDINSKDNSNYTPLHEAVAGNKVEAVQ